MIELPDDILFIIYEYSYNDNINSINKSFYNYLNEMKDSFKNSLIQAPIIVNYTISEWKDCIFEINSRPNLESIKRKNFNISLDNYSNNLFVVIDYKIRPSLGQNNYLINLETIDNKSNETIFDIFGYATYWSVTFNDEISLISNDRRFRYYMLLFVPKKYNKNYYNGIRSASRKI